MSWLAVAKLLCPNQLLSKEQACSATLCGSRFLWREEAKVKVQRSASLRTAAKNGIRTIGDCWHLALGCWKTQNELVDEFEVKPITASNLLLLLLEALKPTVTDALCVDQAPVIGD